MKRLSAIVLSLLLFWVQVFVTAQPAPAGAPAKSNCCSCKRSCCVTPSDASGSAPQPAVPSQSVQLNLDPLTLTASLAWLLPRGAAEIFSAASVSSLSAPRVPLFQRDCALLI
jgi:hypothetical protein